MQPRQAYRLALIMIPLSIAIGVAAGITGEWPLVAIMALNLGFQAVNLRASRNRLRNRD
jgi:hypothetical protein